MELKVYQENKDKDIYLKLCKTLQGVEVVVMNNTDANVNCSTLLSLEPDGVHLYTGISKSSGLPTDSKGAIKICGNR